MRGREGSLRDEGERKGSLRDEGERKGSLWDEGERKGSLRDEGERKGSLRDEGGGREDSMSDDTTDHCSFVCSKPPASAFLELIASCVVVFSYTLYL